MEQMIGMTDLHTTFLGRVGKLNWARVRHCSVYYLAIFMMAFGFSIGAQILIARQRRKLQRKWDRLLSGIYFPAVAVILFTFSIVFSPHILRNIISSPHIYDAAESYIHFVYIYFFGLFCHGDVPCIFCWYDTNKTLTLNSIVMVLSDVVFNYIWFSVSSVSQLGITGTTISSSLAEMVSVIFFIIYTWKRIDCKNAWNILPKFQRKRHWNEILNVSVCGRWFRILFLCLPGSCSSCS